MAGNQAVTAMVQRYEAGEHAAQGEAKVRVNGVEMTVGEVNAMADFFSDVTLMQITDPAELIEIRDLIRRDRAAHEGKPGATAVRTDEWEKATKGRYLKLAAGNSAHFAPQPGGTGDNHRGHYFNLHRYAMQQAVLDRRVSDEAKARNAFAGHFLTDAFAAGHLVNKDMVVAFAKEHFAAAATSGLAFKENAFTKGVARAVLGDPVAGGKLGNRELYLLQWGKVTRERFSEFLYQFATSKPEQFFMAFARMVHDHLNNAIGTPAGGVEVTNARGDTPWRLSGDGTLAMSPRTQQVLTEALQLAEQNLETASRATSEPDYHALTTRVWALAPVPTKMGAETIRHTLDSIADAARPESIAAFAAIAIAEIDAGIAELTNAGYMRLKKP